MQYYSTATLIYVGTSQHENGSPYEVILTRDVKVKEISRFSRYYYSNSAVNQRNMRKARNLVVPRELATDVVRDGITYELQRVTYNGVNYRIYEVLAYFQTDLRVILDCEEIT